MLKKFIIFIIMISSTICCGDVSISLSASASYDIDGYIKSYKWFKYNDTTQSLDEENYILFDPNVSNDYLLFDKDNNFLEIKSSPSIDISLSVGIYYFVLIVEDNNGAVSVVDMDKRVSLDPDDEWITITVLPRINKPPIILTELETKKYKDKMMLLFKEYIYNFILNFV